eukprot:2495376-Rhodomonas_salina.4
MVAFFSRLGVLGLGSDPVVHVGSPLQRAMHDMPLRQSPLVAQGLNDAPHPSSRAKQGPLIVTQSPCLEHRQAARCVSERPVFVCGAWVIAMVMMVMMRVRMKVMGKRKG